MPSQDTYWGFTMVSEEDGCGAKFGAITSSNLSHLEM